MQLAAPGDIDAAREAQGLPMSRHSVSASSSRCASSSSASLIRTAPALRQAAGQPSAGHRRRRGAAATAASMSAMPQRATWRARGRRPARCSRRSGRRGRRHAPPNDRDRRSGEYWFGHGVRSPYPFVRMDLQLNPNGCPSPDTGLRIAPQLPIDASSAAGRRDLALAPAGLAPPRRCSHDHQRDGDDQQSVAAA